MNLRAEGLVKKYARRLVVNQVNLIVNPGEIVGLLGPNGAGKTTCFYLIVGAISSNAGYIFLGDRDITALPMYRRARLGIGYLAQESTVFRKMTVLENVLSVLEYEKMGKAERLDRAHEVLGDLGVGHLSHQRADSLSGGKRVGLKSRGHFLEIRSLCCSTNLLPAWIRVRWKIFRILSPN